MDQNTAARLICNPCNVDVMGGWWTDIKKAGRTVTRPVRKVTAPVRRFVERTPVLRSVNRMNSIAWRTATLRPGSAFRQTKRLGTDFKKDFQFAQRQLARLAETTMGRIAMKVGKDKFLKKGVKTSLVSAGAAAMLPVVTANPTMAPLAPTVPIALSKAYDHVADWLRRGKRGASVTDEGHTLPYGDLPPEPGKKSMVLPLALAAGAGFLMLKG
jgi:hypothetical protein